MRYYSVEGCLFCKGLKIDNSTKYSIKIGDYSFSFKVCCKHEKKTFTNMRKKLFDMIKEQETEK